MSNKDNGRAIAKLPNIDYLKVMGANVENSINLQNTGINFTNWEIYKYFTLLRNYALNRIKWTSNMISEKELRLIEWNIFHYGKCAMVRPRVLGKTIKMILPTYKIYQCNFTKINLRNGEPIDISIINSYNDKYLIDVNYNQDEFAIFTDQFIFNDQNVPFVYVAWEYACKLYELDLMFNANSHKNRMPMVFASAKIDADKMGTNVNSRGTVSIAELMRSAYGRNEQFVEIPSDMVEDGKLIYETAREENYTDLYLDSQQKLFERYFELLGLYTNKERKGVYTVKDLQKDGDETGDFRTECLKSTRRLCAEDASLKFGIDLTLEVM